MQLSEITVVTGRLTNAVRESADLNTFYLKLFNRNHPRTSDGRVDITTSTPLCDFYQKMAQHYALMNWQYRELLAEFGTAANAVLLDTTEEK